MTYAFLWILGLLAFSIWIMAVILILFSAYQQRRYYQLFQFIMARLDKMEERFFSLENQVRVPHETSLSIQKDEPMAKYKNVTLPDDIDINFVEKDA